jgi:hypothetical protein
MLRRIKCIKLKEHDISVVLYRIDERSLVLYVFTESRRAKLIKALALENQSNRDARDFCTRWVHKNYPLRSTHEGQRV